MKLVNWFDRFGIMQLDCDYALKCLFVVFIFSITISALCLSLVHAEEIGGFNNSEEVLVSVSATRDQKPVSAGSSEKNSPIIKNQAKSESSPALPGGLHTDLTLIIRPVEGFSKDLSSMMSEITKNFGPAISWQVIVLPDSMPVDSNTGIDRSILHGVVGCAWQMDANRAWKLNECLRNSVSGTPWSRCVGLSGYRLDDLTSCLESGAQDKILQEFFLTHKNLDLSHLPLLLINGTPFDLPLQTPLVSRGICAGILEPTQRPEACDHLPDCMDDEDCYRDGYISQCLDRGKKTAHCQYLEPIPVPLTVIVPDEAVFSNVDDVLTITRRNFPGVQVRKILANSDEGKELTLRHGITILPAYLFDPIIEEAYYFEQFREGFYRSGDKILLHPLKVGSNLFPLRPRKRGLVSIFFSGLSKNSTERFIDLLELEKRYPAISLNFHALIMVDRQGKLTARGGRAGFEECIRQLVIASYFRPFLLPYLRTWNAAFGTSYWDDTIRTAGLDPEKVKGIAHGEKGQRLALESSHEVSALPLPPGYDMIALIENREIAYLTSRDDVVRLLNGISSGKQ